MDDKQVIDPQIRQKWDDEYRQYGIKVMPDTAMYYEMETFFPSYAFVVLEPKFTSGRIAFFFRDDKPFYPDGNECHWYEIEPQFVKAALARIKDFGISPETRKEFEGYVVPLQENSFFGCWEDVNTYLHNLMYWESVMAADDNGPLATRMTWLSQQLYAMKREEQEYSSFNEVLREKIAELAVMPEREKRKTEGVRDFIARITAQIYEEERMSKESRIRQDMLQKEMTDLQDRIARELRLTEIRKKKTLTVLEELQRMIGTDVKVDAQTIPAPFSK